MTKFTNAPWKSPESIIEDAGSFCSICLINLNPKGATPLKKNCKLPIRSTPGGPVNKNAVRNAMSRIFQMKGVPSDQKRKAARSLVRLAREAGIEVGDSVLKLAGGKK